MKKRPRFLRNLLTPLQRAHREMWRELAADTVWYGTAGTKVWKDDDGKVKVRRMTLSELNEVWAKVKRGEPIPQEYTLL